MGRQKAKIATLAHALTDFGPVQQAYQGGPAKVTNWLPGWINKDGGLQLNAIDCSNKAPKKDC